MREWEDRLNTFLAFNERELLTHAGKVRVEVAEKLAMERYAALDAGRKASERALVDAEDLKTIESFHQRLPGEGTGNRNP